MFTLSLVYVVFYLFIFLSILIVSLSQLPIVILTQLSTTNFMIFIQKYTRVKSLYLWLFFSLTGLPPVGLFFIKFNIFFLILYQTHIFVIIVLFLLFFLNMLYYAQLFNFRNFKKPIYHLMSPNFVFSWYKSEIIHSQFTTYNTYRLILTTVNTLIFITLMLFFFSDYFLVFNVL